MQKTDIPNKYQVAWAQGDTSRVEVPVTTSDATRASQTLGFPPATMQPPEAGGVPPNGEDFNGGLNQISRVARWMMAGNGFPFDNAFATATPIGGYAQGAVIPRADLTGYWVSTADNNTTNPDATDGTAANWLPAWNTGLANVSVSSTDVTVYPVTAAKQVLQLSGTLTANRNVILPAWVYGWQIIDNTVRAGFTLTVKTASGTGVLIQTGAQCVRGDGTNIVQVPASIAAATTGNQAAQLAQIVAPLGGTAALSAIVGASNTNTLTFADDQVIVGTATGGTRWALSNFSKTLNTSTTGAGGMDTGSPPASGAVAIYAGLNTTTGASTIWAQAIGASAPTPTYTGANAPSGYNATALLGLWMTNASGQFIAYTSQQGRAVITPSVSVLAGGGPSAPYTNIGLNNAAPRGAKAVIGSSATTVGSLAQANSALASNVGGAGAQNVTVPATGSPMVVPFRCILTEDRRIYYSTGSSVTNLNVVVTGYEI